MNARTLTAEFIGTFALVFFGAGSIVADQAYGGLGLIGIALANATVLAVMVTMLIRISGAHFNPAVTVALWLANRTDVKTGAAYVVMQMVGAAAAAFLLKGLMPQVAAGVTGLGVPRVADGIDPIRAILLEATMTFFLVSAYLGATSSERPAVNGFGIGLVLLFATLVGGPVTGAALNPARAFGPALAADEWLGHAFYWIGPMLGGAAAALVWGKLLLGASDTGPE